ncbi:MAG: hypothetical protein MUD10_00035 [Candidatus Pacebacteria bacterium]|jgi:hypothetical protein|nr:hypothetical protein [Candidatus Paceibacterota bacterium]
MNQNMPAASNPVSGASEKIMPGFFQLLNETFALYGQKWKSFTILVLAMYGFFIVALFVLLAAIFAVRFIYEASSAAAVIVGIMAAVVGIVAYVYVTIWFAVAMIIILRDNKESIGFAETLKRALPYIGQYFLVNIVAGLIELLGFILLIIPGIIFSVWYMSARYLVVTNGEKGMTAITKSRELARGQFWKIFVLALLGSIALIILQFAVSMVPFFGSLIVGLVLAPLALIYSYQIFDHLRIVKGVAISATGANIAVGQPGTGTALPKTMAGLGLIVFIVLIGLAIAFAPQIAPFFQQGFSAF